MDNGNLVEFHVLFDDQLYAGIMKQAKIRELSLSEFINEVLRESAFFLDKVDFMNGVVFTDYIFNEDDLKIKIDRKIFIDRDLKYKLCHFQDHFKIWSKASLLRYILRRYLMMLVRNGKSGAKRIRDRFYRMWTGATKNIREWTKRMPEEFLEKTHMGFFYVPERIEFVNSYGVTFKIKPLNKRYLLPG